MYKYWIIVRTLLIEEMTNKNKEFITNKSNACNYEYMVEDKMVIEYLPILEQKDNKILTIGKIDRTKAHTNPPVLHATSIIVAVLPDGKIILTDKTEKQIKKGMEKVTLGRTGITVNRNGFGALPIQRVTGEDATTILRKAYAQGIRFFDSARWYSDSEEKLGNALSDVRKDIYIATKTGSTTVEDFWKDLETSLNNLKIDYIDIYQFHNPSFCPKPGDGTGLYEAMLEAKAQGKIHFIGLTNHRLPVAIEACESGLYDTIQFPFSYLADQKDIDLVNKCKENNIGFICMKALSGGLINRSDAAYAYLAQFDNVLPIWGIQKESELDEFISYQTKAPELTQEIQDLIAHDRKELAGDFCRGCGYCMPCPKGIQINQCARMSLMLRRAPAASWLNDHWQAEMKKIEECLNCGKCKQHCPYHLNTPELLKKNYEDYKTFLK